jgi:hypothetical protein
LKIILALILECGVIKEAHIEILKIITYYIILTKNEDNQAGVVWFNQDIYSPFNIEFKFRFGGGSGADGMVFMFYKKRIS